MKIQHFMALVVLSLATVPGARAAVREFKARTFRRTFLFAVLVLLTSGPAFGAIHTNTITGFSFVPRNMTIKAGDTIVWVNVASHSVTGSSAQEAFCGSTIFGASDVSCSATFNVPGTYNYYCRPHNLEFNMNGSVTVQPVFAPTTNTWTGADPSGYWSAPANWSPVGVPVNGNDLVFPGGLPPGDMVSTNDLTGSFFRSISFTQAGGHTIRGNPITLTNRADCIINNGTNVIACDLTFSGTPSTPPTPQFGTFTIRGSFGSGELTLSGNVGGGSLIPSMRRLVMRGQFTGGSIRQWGGDLALYGDNPYPVAVEFKKGTLFVQGSQPNLNITTLWEFESAACPNLSGNGVVGDITGCGQIILDSTLPVKNLGPGAIGFWRDLYIHLNGTNVGEYGRLVASGDVSLSRGFLLPSAGFNPQAGQVFTIVEKTSPGAITNAPFGPEGTITTLNGMPFRISYVGGDGNDVTLTVVTPIPIVLSGMQRSFDTQSVFSYSADVGLRYAVDRSATLSNWTTILTDTANTNPMTVTDFATNQMNFYRVRRLANPP